MTDGIAGEVTSWLERTGLSLTRAGEILDVDRQTLWRWTAGERTPAHPGMLRLAMRRAEELLERGELVR